MTILTKKLLKIIKNKKKMDYLFFLKKSYLEAKVLINVWLNNNVYLIITENISR